MKISKAVGIDLGTTNSVIAMIGRDNEEIICRTDRSGRRTFPSVVAYDRRSDSLQSGAPAFAKRGTAADPIVSIKSHMGDSEFRASTGPITLSPVEVSAVILREMKTQMQNYLDANGYDDHVVDRAVITVPAYFASNAREATTKAAEEAGLKVEFTLQEPTAAVLFYTQRHGIEDGIFLVYDLGGGTFDVSVVKVEGGDVVVLAMAGNNYLGGDNFDEALARFLLTDLQNDTEMGYNLDDFDANEDEEDRRRFIRLLLVAESIKKSLSHKLDHYEEFSNIFTDKDGASVNLAMEISRDTFEDLIRPTLTNTLDEVQKALDQAETDYHVTLDMIDAVLLVGGSTHIPLVSEIIVQSFTDPNLPHHTKQAAPLRYEPDMAVGYGAAVAAAGVGTTTLGEAAAAILSGEAGADQDDDFLVVTTTFSPGAGYAGQSVVKGTLRVLQGSLPGPATALVTRAAGGFQQTYPINEDGSFVMSGLVAESDPEPYACEITCEGVGVETTTFDAAIRNVPEASVALSRSYYIETMAVDGSTSFVQLMRQGETLPITRDFEFATNPDNAYFAELKFFEENDFLKKITVVFDEPVPPRTPVRLSLSCNLQSRFSARAEVAGIVVDTQFEPSPAPPLPTAEQVSKAASDARARAQQIQAAGDRIVTTRRVDRVTTELEEAVAAHDAGKARDKLNELTQLTKNVAPVELDPSREEFEALRRRCEEANETGQGDPRISREIQSVASAAYSAYDAKDQQRLSAAVNDMNKILSMLTQKDTDGKGGDDQPPAWMLVMVFGQKTLGFIEAAEANDQVPASVHRQWMEEAPADRAEIEEAIRACTPTLPPQLLPDDWIPESEAVKHFVVLQKLYPKWEKRATMTGTIVE